MNCFEWQNSSSDYLDGTLSDSLKRESDDHLETCRECSDRCKHYRMILSQLASQSRIALPANIKKAPFSAALYIKPEMMKASISRWESIPWYMRTLLEAAAIVLLVLGGITGAPKLKALYERSLEKGLSDFKESINVADTNPEQMDPVVPPLEVSKGTSGGTQEEELNGEDDSESDHVRVGRSELWRFTLKTVSPDELRPQVVKALTELNIPPDTPGIGGNQVPGGIEFDLVLPQSMVASIKHAVQKLAPKSADHPDDLDANFSWYKVKSKRKLPDGKSQVVIWLSQPNN